MQQTYVCVVESLLNSKLNKEGGFIQVRVPGCAWSGSILASCNYYIARARLLSVSTQLMDDVGRRMEKMWGFFPKNHPGK